MPVWSSHKALVLEVVKTIAEFPTWLDHWSARMWWKHTNAHSVEQHANSSSKSLLLSCSRKRINNSYTWKVGFFYFYFLSKTSTWASCWIVNSVKEMALVELVCTMNHCRYLTFNIGIPSIMQLHPTMEPRENRNKKEKGKKAGRKDRERKTRPWEHRPSSWNWETGRSPKKVSFWNKVFGMELGVRCIPLGALGEVCTGSGGHWFGGKISSQSLREMQN